MSEEAKQITGSFVTSLPGEDDIDTPLTLKRTKAYSKKLLEIPVPDLVKLVTQQAQLVILLLGEQALRIIEEIETAPFELRESLHLQLENTLARSGEMAQRKNALITAIGYDPLALTTDAEGRPIAAVTKTTIGKDQFESMFAGLNPFATVQDAKLDAAEKFVSSVLTPEEKAKLDRSIKDVAGKAADRIRASFDDPDQLN